MAGAGLSLHSQDTNRSPSATSLGSKTVQTSARCSPAQLYGFPEPGISKTQLTPSHSSPARPYSHRAWRHTPPLPSCFSSAEDAQQSNDSTRLAATIADTEQSCRRSQYWNSQPNTCQGRSWAVLQPLSRAGSLGRAGAHAHSPIKAKPEAPVLLSPPILT